MRGEDGVRSETISSLISVGIFEISLVKPLKADKLEHVDELNDSMHDTKELAMQGEGNV